MDNKLRIGGICIAVVFFISIFCVSFSYADAHTSLYPVTNNIYEWWMDPGDGGDLLGNVRYRFLNEALFSGYGGMHGRIDRYTRLIPDSGNGQDPTSWYQNSYYDKVAPTKASSVVWTYDMTLTSGVYLYGELYSTGDITINGDVTISVVYDSWCSSIYVPSGSRLTILGSEHWSGSTLHEDMGSVVKLRGNAIPTNLYMTRGYSEINELTLTETFYLTSNPFAKGYLESWALPSGNVDADGYYYYHYLNENYLDGGKGRIDQKKREIADEKGAKSYRYQYFNPILDTLIIDSDTTLPDFYANPPTPFSLVYNLSMLKILPGVTLTLDDNVTFNVVYGGMVTMGELLVTNSASVHISDFMAGGSLSIRGGTVVLSSGLSNRGGSLRIGGVPPGTYAPGSVVVEGHSTLWVTGNCLSPFAQYEWAYAGKDFTDLMSLIEYDIFGRKISETIPLAGAAAMLAQSPYISSDNDPAAAQLVFQNAYRKTDYYASTGRVKAVTYSSPDENGVMAYQYEYLDNASTAKSVSEDETWHGGVNIFKTLSVSNRLTYNYDPLTKKIVKVAIPTTLTIDNDTWISVTQSSSSSGTIKVIAGTLTIVGPYSGNVITEGTGKVVMINSATNMVSKKIVSYADGQVETVEYYPGTGYDLSRTLAIAGNDGCRHFKYEYGQDYNYEYGYDDAENQGLQLVREYDKFGNLLGELRSDGKLKTYIYVNGEQLARDDCAIEIPTGFTKPGAVNVLAQYRPPLSNYQTGSGQLFSSQSPRLPGYADPSRQG